MGFYPVCPTSNQYVLGTPLFKKMTLNLENGKKVVLNAPKNSDANKYIYSVNFNGKLYNNDFLNHADLLKGAVLDFNMSAQPNKQRGIAISSLPYSLSNDN
jgi:putative alpha-1,2-mannosidase